VQVEAARGPDVGPGQCTTSHTWVCHQSPDRLRPDRLPTDGCPGRPQPEWYGQNFVSMSHR